MTIPTELDTTQFRQAWSEWLQYRSERKEKTTPTGSRRSLMELAKLGPERATAAIYHSIANNWKGIFEPQNVGGQQPDVMKNLRDYANGVAP